MVEHCMGVEEVMFVEKLCPFTGVVFFFIGIDEEDDFLVLGEKGRYIRAKIV